MMRSGRFLAEESPENLLKIYKAPNLEDVFLKLSQIEEQNAIKGEIPQVEVQKPRKTSTSSLQNLKVDCSFNCCKVSLINFGLSSKIKNFYFHFQFTTRGKSRALLTKNFLRCWRNVGAMVFTFALPIIQVILFCMAIGRDATGLRFAIVNHESNHIPCDLDQRLTHPLYSCRYLSYLTNNIKQEYYENVEDALKAVKQGDAWGAMEFKKNFTLALIARVTQGIKSPNYIIEESQINIWLDMSNEHIGILLNRDFQVKYHEFVFELMQENGKVNPKAADVPLYFNEPVYGSEETSFTEFTAPGVILT
jgi:hypothetical protein